MNIEIAESGRMTQSGSSLLKLIQNNNMQILDLLVRESVQNSLDAYREESEFVQVEFLTGKFNTKMFNRHLEGVEEQLNKKISIDESSYIAIKDSNTKGLTGKMHYDDLEENDYGNLLKLVYEISKPQENSGAGGSWGLGKTIYFRVGIGMVVYYSRVMNDDNSYESRLAISMVEDEKSKESIIPKLDKQLKRGIAWWGQSIGDNKTIPITDNKKISEILNIFNIKEYKDEETGTTVIIPYIYENKLLPFNEINKENVSIPYWKQSIEEYLKISVQRWYSPRLNNKEYVYGKWLKVLINGKQIEASTTEPIFKIIQTLYNIAINNKDKENDLLNNCDIKISEIKLRNVLRGQKAGCLVYTKLNKEVLRMIPPDNKLSPFEYIDKENHAGENNKAIILYTRKPGMIVSYETTGAWADSLPETNKDEFLIGIFVLNSDNIINKFDYLITLEEYIRQSEKADHTSWNDWAYGGSNPKIVSKIQSHVRSTISKSYNIDNENKGCGRNFGLGKMFGDILLPPEDFGKQPSLGRVGNSEHKNTTSHKGVSLKVEYNKLKFTSNTIEIPFHIKCKKNISEISLDIAIVTENEKISIKEWENELEQKVPFILEKVIIEQINKEYIISKENTLTFKDNEEINIDDFNIQFINSISRIPYGIIIRTTGSEPYDINGTFLMKPIERNIRTVLDIHANERDK